MSQQQTFQGVSPSPPTPQIEFVQGNDSVNVGPDAVTGVIQLIGDTAKGVSVLNTAPHQETVSVAFATTSTPGVASFDSTDFNVAAGVVSLAGEPGFTWNVVTSVSPANPIDIVPNNGYICNGGSPVTFVLPGSPAIGDGFTIISNTTTFVITENPSQQMGIGDVLSTATSGILTSESIGDQAAFIYMGGNIFRAFAPQGSLVFS